MEEKSLDLSQDSPTRERQIGLIRAGQGLVHGAEGDEPSLTEVEYGFLQEGKWDDLTLKQQYWARKYYSAGLKAQQKAMGDIQKNFARPCTVGQAMGIANDLVFGKDGLRQIMDDKYSSVNVYLAVLAEALSLKGLLTADDLDAARASLIAKAEASQKEVEVKAKEAIETGAKGSETAIVS